MKVVEDPQIPEADAALLDALLAIATVKDDPVCDPKAPQFNAMAALMCQIAIKALNDYANRRL